MSATAHSSHLAFQTSLLRALEEQASALRLARDDARQALLRAQFTVDTLEADVGDVEGRIEGLRASIQALNARLNPRVMATLPVEILRMVFTWLAVKTATSWTWDETPAWERSCVDARTPYRMAAVCRRWRREAVNKSALWSFIVVDQLDSRMPEHVATMVERSGTASIDIHLDWSQYTSPFSHSHADTALASLASAARRWRRVSIILPKRNDHANILHALLRRPTPVLEELVVSSKTNAVPDEGIVRYLPECPRLRKLQMVDVAFLCRQLRQPLASLVILDLTVSTPALDIWQLLQHTPALESLKVIVVQYEHDMFTAPTGRLFLPVLRHLYCQSYALDVFDAWAGNVDLPVLQRLDMDCCDVDHMSNLLHRVCDTVTSFSCTAYEDVLRSTEASTFAQLRNVTSVRLEDHWVEPDFFQNLTANSAWPKMRTLSLAGPWRWESDSAEAFVDFVRSRTIRRPDHDTDAPCRLLRVDFIANGSNTPDWLVDQVNFYTNSSSS